MTLVPMFMVDHTSDLQPTLHQRIHGECLLTPRLIGPVQLGAASAEIFAWPAVVCQGLFPEPLLCVQQPAKH